MSTASIGETNVLQCLGSLKRGNLFIHLKGSPRFSETLHRSLFLSSNDKHSYDVDVIHIKHLWLDGTLIHPPGLALDTLHASLCDRESIRIT